MAVVLGEEGKYDPKQFWVENDRLRYGTSQETSSPLTGVTHMLFRIESRTERDDWMGLTNIIKARDEALKDISEENDQADAAIKRTMFLVRTSPDLTRADRKRVADALKTDFEEAKEGLESTGDFEVVAQRATRMDVNVALSQTESLTEIFI